MNNENDIMEIEEAAAYLKMHRQTLREKVAAFEKGAVNEVPGKKVAGKWVFSRRKLLKWVENGGTK